MNSSISDTEPPLICEHCLGSKSENDDEPHNQDEIHITKVPDGAQCKICSLVFPLYYFKQNPRSRDSIRTVICQRCAKQRHVCQCCMLDLTWHIPIEERDMLVSVINEDDSMTVEAKNIMMKRYLALKKDAKFGGAKVTGDAAALNDFMERLKEREQGEGDDIVKHTTMSRKTTRSETHKSRIGDHVDISHILRKLPLRESFELTGTPITRSFFLYNIDTAIPEWKISDAIASVVGTRDWRAANSNSLVVNHKAHAGGIQFATEELSKKFVLGLTNRGKDGILTAKNGTIKRGILKVDGKDQVFVVPWKSGFSSNSLGRSIDENVALSVSLRRLVIEELTGGERSRKTPDENAGSSQQGQKAIKRRIPVRTQRRKDGKKYAGGKSKRIASLTL